MAKFECVRYPRLFVYEFDVQFDGGVLVTDDPQVISGLSSDRYPDVKRVDDDPVPAAESEAGGEPRYAYPQTRGWFTVEGLDRKVRREDIPSDVVVLDEDGNPE